MIMNPVMKQVFIEHLLCAKSFESVCIEFSSCLGSVRDGMFFPFYERTDNN